MLNSGILYVNVCELSELTNRKTSASERRTRPLKRERERERTTLLHPTPYSFGAQSVELQLAPTLTVLPRRLLRTRSDVTS